MEKLLFRTKASFYFIGYFICAYYGGFLGLPWALNLLKFISILGAISNMVMFGKKQQDEELARKYRQGLHLPKWLDMAGYTVMSYSLAAWGHWFLALCWIFIAAGDLGMREKALKNK